MFMDFSGSRFQQNLSQIDRMFVKADNSGLHGPEYCGGGKTYVGRTHLFQNSKATLNQQL